MSEKTWPSTLLKVGMHLHQQNPGGEQHAHNSLRLLRISPEPLQTPKSAPACIRRRIIHNSAGFLRLREPTLIGSGDSACCIPLLTFPLNITHWNPLFKHVEPSCAVPSDAQTCAGRLKAAYHRLPVNKSVSSTVRAPGGNLTMGFHYTEPQHSRKSVRR